MFKPSHVVLGAALLIATLAISSTNSSLASESQKFKWSAYDDDFRGYIRHSELVLNTFDDWTRGKVGEGENSWRNHSNVVLNLLREAYEDAEATAEEKSVDLPDELLDWYEDERTAWENVLSIGSELIDLHNTILERTPEIREHTVLIKKRIGKAIISATTLQKILEELLGMPTGAPPPDVEKPLERMIKASAQTLSVRLSRIKAEVELTLRTIERAEYPARLKALQNERIDPDQAGEFVKHERTWERNLRSVLEDFLDAAEEYKRLTSPASEETALAPFSYLKGRFAQLPGRVDRFLRDAAKRLTRAKQEEGPPTASIRGIRIKDFREPGERQRVRVLVANNGQSTLTKKDLDLRCRVKRHPKGYDPAKDDFSCSDVRVSDDIEPRGAQNLEYEAVAPMGTGDWTLEWELFYEGELLDKATESFRVKGERNAKFIWVKINGRDVKNKRVIKPTDKVKFRIDIENTGTTTLLKTNSSLRAKFIKKDSGGPTWRSANFAVRLHKDLEPGKRWIVKRDIAAPKKPGEWRLEIVLLVQGDELLSTDKTIVAKSQD